MVILCVLRVGFDFHPLTHPSFYHILLPFLAYGGGNMIDIASNAYPLLLLGI